jgi:cytochrome c oxidase subunit 2
MTSDVSLQTGTVDSVFYFIIGISAFFLILITFLMVFFTIKYHKKRNIKATNIEGNTALEVLWTVIPTIIALVMFYVGWKGFVFLRTVPEGAMDVKVTARMWSWMFEYENGLKTDTLKVPVDKPIKLLLTSQDVIHSFFVPAFRIKEDAVPGLENHLWFEAKEEGSYDVLCAEYCGLQHAYMLTKVQVVSEEQFESWYQEQGSKIQESVTSDTASTLFPQSMASGGQKLLQVKGCVACHSSDGSKMIGPTFKGLFGTQQVVVTNGKKRTVQINEEYLRNAILKPGLDIVEGYDPLMPSQEGMISEEELKGIIQYLKDL